MPRGPRLDAPGVLHHVMARGIDRQRIFQHDTDREDFVQRLAGLAEAAVLTVYAWALMPNHFHLLVRTGRWPLAAVGHKPYQDAVAKRLFPTSARG